MFVYLIRCGDFAKIGTAGDAQRRMGELQVGNPHKLTLSYSEKFSRKEAQMIERFAHSCLRDDGKWRRGEWFKATNAEMLAALDHAKRTIVGDRALSCGEEGKRQAMERVASRYKNVSSPAHP